MADEEDWESEEFSVPSFVPPPVKSGWDDEDVPEEVVTPVSKPNPALLAANAKKAAEEEAAIEAKLRNMKLEKETPEERKLRERLQAEEADAELSADLFGGAKASGSSGSSSAVKGLGAIALKTKQDHMTFGTTVSQKLSQSSAFNIAAFYKTLSKTLENPVVTSEVLDEILAEITKIRETKAKLEKAAKPAVVKKSKKEIAVATKKHNDKYGGSDYVDKYDHYNDMEDDFM